MQTLCSICFRTVMYSELSSPVVGLSLSFHVKEKLNKLNQIPRPPQSIPAKAAFYVHTAFISNPRL